MTGVLVNCLCFCHSRPKTNPNTKETVVNKMMKETIAMIIACSLDIPDVSVDYKQHYKVYYISYKLTDSFFIHSYHAIAKKLKNYYNPNHIIIILSCYLESVTLA